MFNFSKGSKKEGDYLPALVLKDQNGNNINTGSFTGSWSVLYFYPLDNTRGCTRQAVEYDSFLSEFKKHEIKVFGINTQKPEKHAKFIKKHNLKINILSDPGGKLATKLGVNMILGICFRDTIVVDPEGKINKIFRYVNPETDTVKVLNYIIQQIEKNDQ